MIITNLQLNKNWKLFHNLLQIFQTKIKCIRKNCTNYINEIYEASIHYGHLQQSWVVADDRAGKFNVYYMKYMNKVLL